MNLNELYPTVFLLQLLISIDHTRSIIELEAVFLVFDCCLLRESEVPSELPERNKILFSSTLGLGLLNIYWKYLAHLIFVGNIFGQLAYIKQIRYYI